MSFTPESLDTSSSAACETAGLRILVVDDEDSVLDTLRHVLGGAHEVTSCLGGAKAIEVSRSAQFDLALVDLLMPAPGGLEVLRALRELQPECVRVLMSARRDADAMAEAAEEVGVAKVLTKPFVGYQVHALLASLPKRAEASGADAFVAAEREGGLVEWDTPASSTDERARAMNARRRSGPSGWK